ncbi:MAG: class F sortase [bacterium]|nr:class F sortase [bacterium]
MKAKPPFKQPPFIIPVGGIAFLSIVIFSATLGLYIQDTYTKSIPSTINQKTPQILSAINREDLNIPDRIRIPKIKLDTAIEHVGLNSKGEVGVPKGTKNTAWFELGPHPGNVGSAIITGHFGYWKNGAPAIFNNLYKLKKGDKIYIKDKKGVTAIFVVRESRNYNPSAHAAEIFTSDDGGSHLNLITCKGTWNKKQKTYSERLVIFTDRVDE